MSSRRLRPDEYEELSHDAGRFFGHIVGWLFSNIERFAGLALLVYFLIVTTVVGGGLWLVIHFVRKYY